jgi:hypothetical protein
MGRREGPTRSLRQGWLSRVIGKDSCGLVHSTQFRFLYGFERSGREGGLAFRLIRI